MDNLEVGSVVSFKDEYIYTRRPEPEGERIARRGRFIVLGIGDYPSGRVLQLRGVDYEMTTSANESEVQQVFVLNGHRVRYEVECTVGTERYTDEFRKSDAVLHHVEDRLMAGCDVRIRQIEEPIPLTLNGFNAFRKALGHPEVELRGFVEHLQNPTPLVMHHA